jgi:DtxR family Mn-dependent transcriptional regulator
MVKKLQAKKLLTYEKYYGCRLTAAGNKVALSIIRRHRLWEYFLSEKLGFGWEEVHEIAEQLEHVQSELLTEKLDTYLGHPRFDPHGDPIPDGKGKMASQQVQVLHEAPMKTSLRVQAVQNQSNELLEMLAGKKLQIGTRLQVQKRFDFDGSMEVLLNGKETVSISEKLAKALLVTKS